MPDPKSPFKRVRRRFDRPALKRVCEMHETEFAGFYDMSVTEVTEQPHPDNFYAFLDRGSDILAVAHLDTVMPHERRTANFIDTAAGPVVYSGALDDRLGAYTILELLPKLGVNVDVLLTVGEESGMSTGAFFEASAHHDREYNWMIEFDRGGVDVVMYQYEDYDTVDLVRAAGARVGSGSFSDIAFLEHLEIKGFNWGVGYQDYHGPRSHAYLEDYWMMVGHFLEFHEANAEVYLPHEDAGWWGRSRSRSNWWSGYGGYGLDELEPGESDLDPYAAEAEAELAEAELLDEALFEREVFDDDVVSDDFNVVNARLLATETVDS
jgi:hypothetical protein